MLLSVPVDDVLYPTLGPQVCQWMEENLVFGPGDLRGDPLVLDQERKALIYRMYEVFPRGHAQEGRRRFRRCAISLPKGLGKTELGALVAAAELHPAAPVRCVGWSKRGEPVGGPVTDPYVALIAFNEEQSDELAYGAMRTILGESSVSDDFDIGLDRILRVGGDGKAVSLASSPSARDGARTTFVLCDETHHWTLPRLKKAHQTSVQNLGKRKLSDPWLLEITTAGEPGAGSVAEDAVTYAEQVKDGRIKDAAFFYFQRSASDKHDLTTEAGARSAVIEASGAAASWRDIEAIVDIWRDPTTDRSFWERVWCNRWVRGSSQAFDVEKWKALAREDNPVQDGDLITLGFDGAPFHDSTALVATHVYTGFQWIAGLWECPPGRDDWQTPTGEVDAAIRAMFEKYEVFRLYADPPYFQSWIARWEGEFGSERVISWWTNRRRQMAASLEGFHTAIAEGLVSHDGDARLSRHLGAARRKDVLERDDQGKHLWLIQKERPDSPHKIDAAMAAVLSWEARNDAVSEGMLERSTEPVVMVL